MTRRTTTADELLSLLRLLGPQTFLRCSVMASSEIMRDVARSDAQAAKEWNELASGLERLANRMGK